MKRSHYPPLVLALLAALLLLLSGTGVRVGLWSFRTGFTLLKWAGYLGIATTLLAIVVLLVPRLRTGIMLPVLALVVGLSVAYVPWHWKRRAQAAAPIHDITTDTERPPEFVAILPLRANAANSAEYGGSEIAAQQHKAYPDIQPVVLPIAPDSAFRIGRAAAQQMRWDIVAADSADGRIEATATTPWFGFKDDVVVRVEPAGPGSRVDVRSVSRVGGGDVGTNAARIRKYVDRLSRLAHNEGG